MWVALYVLSILAVNLGFSYTPVIDTPLGPWPPMSLAVGLVFVLRDFAQRQTGHRVLLAMLLGAGLSYLMADPYVATASVTAFLASELLDWALYTFTGRPFRDRVLISSSISTPADSLVFLGMIGLASVPAVALMTASKMLAALVVWRLIPRAAA